MPTSLAGRGHQNAYSDVAASATDGALVTGVAGKRIRVHALGISCGGTASTVVLNTKPGGAGTAIGPIFNNSISLPYVEAGWLATGIGEGLTVTTGAGSTTGVLVVYSLV